MNSPESEAISHWLIGEGRRSGDAVQIVDGYVRRLIKAGVPISRARVAQRLANPLLSAWGIIWTSAGAQVYTVPKITLSTDAWHGSPFEYVLNNNRSLHKSLLSLSPEDHITYHELAASGGKDFFVTFLEYGDGSRQGCSFLTNLPSGFESWHLKLIDDTRSALAAALEPIAMRHSTESLLRVYLGNDPAKAVVQGSIERGQHVQTEAAIMFADLRGFTAKSNAWSERELLTALDDYFEAFVDAVIAHGGDVLKFMGDGILAIFPGETSLEGSCRNALSAAKDAISGLNAKNQRRADAGLQPLAAGIGLSFGPVTYGNIGSPDRLDFTVVGAAVNRASRIQDLCKETKEPILFEETIAKSQDGPVKLIGSKSLRGMPGSHQIYSACLS